MCPDAKDVDLSEPQEPAATILVVEDEVLIRLAVCDFLRDCGFLVLEAANGPEAQAVLLSEPDVDLVFSDIHMPEPGDGLRLADWVHAKFPGLPVILTSGVSESLDAAERLCANVVGRVPKPYEHARLLEHVRSVLGDRAANGAQ